MARPLPARTLLAFAVLAIAMNVVAAGVFYSSYTSLWNSWKLRCRKSYPNATEAQKRFLIFKKNCQKAGLPASGTLSSWAKLPCSTADRTWAEVQAFVSQQAALSPLLVADDVLLALFWGWKLQYQIQGYSTDAEEARGLSNFMALVRAQRGGLNLEQLLKLLWTTYYTQRPCACRCGWE